MTQVWAMRSHLQQASVLATANYPETIDSIFVVNSPSFFPTVWGWVQVRLLSYSTPRLVQHSNVRLSMFRRAGSTPAPATR